MGSGFRIDLPWRVTQGVRVIVFAGPFLVLFGGLFGFAGWKGVMAPEPDGSVPGAWFAALMGSSLLLLGLWMLTSRATVRVDVDRGIEVDESVGPFKLTRSFAIGSLTHVAAVRTPMRARYTVIDEHGAMKLYTTDGKATVVMSNYRRKVVCDVVKRVAEALGYVPVDLEGADEFTEIEFAYPNLEVEQPVSAVAAAAAAMPINATREKRGAGVCLEAPPSGMTPLLGNMCFFGLLFVIAPVPFAVLFWVKMQDKLWVLGLPGLLIGSGASLLLYALAVSRRRAMLEVDENELVVTLFGGLWGKRKLRWPREQILNVEVVDGTVSVQDRIMKRLHIHSRFGARKIMQGRPEHELNWIAEQLRDELGIDHPGDD